MIKKELFRGKKTPPSPHDFPNNFWVFVFSPLPKMLQISKIQTARPLETQPDMMDGNNLPKKTPKIQLKCIMHAANLCTGLRKVNPGEIQRIIQPSSVPYQIPAMKQLRSWTPLPPQNPLGIHDFAPILPIFLFFFFVILFLITTHSSTVWRLEP